MKKVVAVVLAAGLSSRMGQMKVLLPWRDGETVIDKVITELKAVPVEAINVIVGHQAEALSERVKTRGIHVVPNPDYATGEMLSSFKTGINAAPEDTDALMIVLGDQPRIKASVVREVIEAYQVGKGNIVAPSWNMRRGHPILIDRQYWAELLALPPDAAPRDVINRHGDAIHYVVVDDDSILGDVDTPEQYAVEREKAGLPPVTLSK